jgi:hypothetical protein
MPAIATRTHSTRPASVALARVADKQRVVEQVAVGRLTLLDGAARFAALGPNLPTTADDLEGLCRTVIGWAGLSLSDCPERAAAVVGRLEEQLRRLLERPGGVGVLTGA